MLENSNTSFLDLLIARAKQVGSQENSSVTAERFLVAVLDCIDGTVKINDMRTTELLAELIRSFYSHDPAILKGNLLAVVNDKDNLSYMDSLYFQNKLCAAQLRVENEQLMVASLVKYILEDPTEKIKNCLGLDLIVATAAGFEKSVDFVKEDHTVKKNENDAVKLTADTDAKDFMAKLTEKVKNAQKTLSEVVFGQDKAISIFTTGYFQAELLSVTDKKRVRPRATFLFAGPPGVGKTFLAEKIAEVLELPFMRFDMSEYADKESNLEFCGSDKVYKNAKAGNVTGFVEKNPKCVILFDEIEKAHLNVIHLFLQMLDAGRLRDNFTDVEVPFTDAIIIFTTNAGKQLYENSDSSDFSDVSRKVILSALQKDTHPETGIPFFPAAMCSRFASGNVVMFNHMSAHNLVDIAKREILRHAGNFEKEIGIKVEIDETVYTALLFAEGGAADARTVRSRSEAFFDDEVYELFRLMDRESIMDLEKLRIGVELPEGNPEIMTFFKRAEKPGCMVFSSDETAELCRQKNGTCSFTAVSNVDQALDVLRSNKAQIILLDLFHGKDASEKEYLNIEDIDSAARDFFRFVRDKHSDIPVYLLECNGKTYTDEENVSFMRHGVRGVLSLNGNTDDFSKNITDICNNLHQQNSMSNLAKANKLISYETAQEINSAEKTAEVKLFDFKLSVAVDSEDSENILSNLSKPNVKFHQVIGAEDAKKELKYFVEYLKNPKKYLGTGVQAPKGVLLYGPPGTGKTLLAKAMAGESDVTFITAEGNQFLRKYIGEGSEKVHELFRVARKYAPSILFIDEIDAIAKERKGSEQMSGSEATLTAFLTEMDGFKSDPTKPVFVLAATNFDVEPGGDKSLDPAMMRRFDRRVFIDLPKRDDRVKYLDLKISGNPTFEISKAKFENIAVRSTGMSLAELESVLELSLRMAIRDGNGKVTDEIFDEAFEIFNSGEKKTWDISQLERVARHEAGHAFMCWYNGETPAYLTIVARSNHGGYMQHGDNEGKSIYTKDELLARIKTALGGRAAEIVYYGEKDGISTGASGDLNSATNVASQIVCTYGMDEDFGLAVIDPQTARMGVVSAEVRTAVNKILSREMENTIRIISENKSAVDALVDELMAKNQLTGEEIDKILKG